MAFRQYKMDDGRALPYEYLPAEGLTPKVGLALKMDGGKLAVQSGAEAPAYICMAEREDACGAEELIPAVRVQPDVIWETETDEDMDAVQLGDKVSLSSDGLSVTAATGGAAEVVEKDGKIVRVRFVL